MRNSDFLQESLNATADDRQCYARAHTHLPYMFILLEEGLLFPIAEQDLHMQELVREAIFLRFLAVRTLIVRAFYTAIDCPVPERGEQFVESVPRFVQAGLVQADQQEDFCAMLHLAYSLSCLREHFELTPQEYFEEVTSFLPHMRTWCERAKQVKFN